MASNGTGTPAVIAKWTSGKLEFAKKSDGTALLTIDPAKPLDAMLQGAAAGYKVARGIAAVTGTATVATGLAAVVAVIATAQDDLDGTSLGAVSATIGDQNGAPAAGSVILKCWKATSSSVTTLIAATVAKNVNWIAIGT